MPRYGLIDADYVTRLRQAADRADGPIYMLGLTRLLPGTDTSPRGLPAVGRDVVTDYAPIPLLASVGASIVFHLTGPVERDISVIVDGRARHVDRVENPTVELATDSTTFIQLAAGRIDPQQQLDTGRVRVSGDRDLANQAALNLRFTI